MSYASVIIFNMFNIWNENVVKNRASVFLANQLREPFWHFVAISIILFSGEYFFSTEHRPNSFHEMSDHKRKEIQENFHKRYGRMPETQELNKLVDDWVKNEMLYQKGLELGLDKNDGYIRDRIVMKTEKLLRRVASTTVPSESDLDAWFHENKHDYLRPPTISFEHHKYSTNNQKNIQAAKKFVAELSGRNISDKLDRKFHTFNKRRLDALQVAMGEEFVSSLAGLPKNTWQIVEANNDIHIVRLLEYSKAPEPVLAQVKELVQIDWAKNEQRKYITKVIDNMKEGKL